MNKEAESYKLIITVKLIYGEKVTHTFEAPKDNAQAKKFVEQLADSIATAMKRKKEAYLYLQNPSITYNPENISYIYFDVIGPEEWQEIVRQAQERIGFTK